MDGLHLKNLETYQKISLNLTILLIAPQKLQANIGNGNFYFCPVALFKHGGCSIAMLHVSLAERIFKRDSCID